MTQKEAAIDFLRKAATGQVREAYNQHVAKDFVHHNAHFKGDRNSLLVAMDEAAKANPRTTIAIKKTVEDKNHVMVLSHLKHTPDDAGYAVVHLFRFENHQVVEMWDLGMQVPNDCPNENGIF